jgi:hypothetical protein
LEPRQRFVNAIAQIGTAITKTLLDAEDISQTLSSGSQAPPQREKVQTRY